MSSLENLSDGELTELKDWYKKLTKRQRDVIINSYDTKYSFHLVRLLLECEQILSTGDLILDRDSETYKSIRRGEWSKERIVSWFEEKEKTLETLYRESTLPHKPDEDKIKQLLLECMEMHYGSLSNVVADQSKESRLLRDLQQLVDRYS